MDNLALWHSVEKTPTEHTKKITGKSYSGTSPKPHYLVMKATEAFGPCGIGWGFTIVSERVEEGAGGERMHIAHVKVWYVWDAKRGEVEHIGGTPFSGTRKDGKPFTDEDAPKKSVTDALVKALSMIGFSGDIFIGRYDDSKYVQELQQEEAAKSRQEPRQRPESPAPQQSSADTRYNDCKSVEAYKAMCLLAIKTAKTADWLRAFWLEQKPNRARFHLRQESGIGHDLLTAYQDRIAEMADAPMEAA